MEQKSSKKRYKIIFSILISILIIMVVAFFVIRNTVFKPFEIEKTEYLYIDKQTSYENVVEQLKKIGLPSEKFFRLLSERMNYGDKLKTGRYAVKKGATMPEIIRDLRSGRQASLNITFNNIRTKENLAGRLSNQLMMDSLELLDALRDEVKTRELGFDDATIVCMFIPNTYEVYWDTGVDNFLNRMKTEYNRFWNDNRTRKAESVGLSPVQVSILASIVEEEATYSDEYATVAGLYLNRLKKGMRLEADPTVKFAIGDFSIRRILFRHLEIESPYNTYRNTGLPPGPIRIPSIKAIDATLSPEENNYLFMCAKDDLSGRHNFSVTHAEHARNAARYQRALNERRIY